MQRTTFYRRVVPLLVALLAVGVAAGPASAGKLVMTRGGDAVVVNQSLSSTLHFAPGVIYVHPGEFVTWKDGDRSGDPHSITVARKAKLPDTVDEIFNCEICSLINAHLEDPEDPNSSLARLRVDKGPTGMQSEGDSLVLLPGKQIAYRVKAQVGRRIHYFCAFHPWMQGTLKVNRTGRAPR